MSLHLGLLFAYNKESHNGVIIDSNKNGHIFMSKNYAYDSKQFVTYEGEDFEVEDVIPLTEYAIMSIDQWHKAKPVKMAIVDYNPDLYDKWGHGYSSNGAESYILKRYVNGEGLCPIPQSYTPIDYFHKASKYAEYVRSNMKEIADSYRVVIESTHICKIGGDDRFYVDRNVSIKYRDGYLDRFFLRSKNLFRDSGYTSNFTSPYKTGEDYEEEKRARELFFREYDYDEHHRYLMDEYQKESYYEEIKHLKEKMEFLEYWQINFSYFERVESIVRSNTEPFFDKENRNRVSNAGLAIKRKFDDYNKGLYEDL